MAEPIVEIRNLHVVRDSFQVSLPKLTIAAGECVALCGVSGSGKSTLLEAIGLLSPWQQVDRYNLAGFDLLQHKSPCANLRVALVGIMPQVGGLLPFLNIEENLRLQIKLTLQAQVAQGLAKENNAYEQALRFEALQAMIDRFELQDHLGKYPEQLSIGQRQRALFIRSVAHRPRLLLVDEPTSALDPMNAQILFDLIEQCAHEFAMGVILVTHDMHAAQKYRIYQFDSKNSTRYHAIFA